MPLASPLSPYLRLMRMHQPVGVWLLMWPCIWSITLASEGDPSLLMLAIYALGAIAMRSAGCIVNDIWDRKFDVQVERTKNRPLASGELSVKQALFLLTALLIIAFALACWLGVQTVLYAAYSLPLIVLYPLMKRITWWPQLFLGLTFNWGALLGWVSVHGQIEMPALLLYAGGIFWTLAYDTIYAHQDIADDTRIGVKSTARRLGKNSKLFVGICYALFFALFAIAVKPTPFSATFILVGIAIIYYNLYRLKLADGLACKRFFILNAKVAALFFIAILVG